VAVEVRQTWVIKSVSELSPVVPKVQPMIADEGVWSLAKAPFLGPLVK